MAQNSKPEMVEGEVRATVLLPAAQSMPKAIKASSQGHLQRDGTVSVRSRKGSAATKIYRLPK